MFDKLGQTLFTQMISMGGGATKRVRFVLSETERYDAELGETVADTTIANVSGFWGSFSEDEIAKLGVSREHVKFSFPVGKMPRLPNVDEPAFLGTSRYRVAKTWVDAGNVQVIVSLRAG